MTKSRKCAIISQYNLPYLEAFSPTLFQFAYPFKIETFFLVPQELINSIYDAFIASYFPTTNVSFQIWKQIEAKSGENGDEKDLNSFPKVLMKSPWISFGDMHFLQKYFMTALTSTLSIFSRFNTPDYAYLRIHWFSLYIIQWFLVTMTVFVPKDIAIKMS